MMLQHYSTSEYKIIVSADSIFKARLWLAEVICALNDAS